MISIPHTANLEGKTNQKSISAAGVLVKKQHEIVKVLQQIPHNITMYVFLNTDLDHHCNNSNNIFVTQAGTAFCLRRHHIL
jgi:hypothetical protein